MDLARTELDSWSEERSTLETEYESMEGGAGAKLVEDQKLGICLSILRGEIRAFENEPGFVLMPLRSQRRTLVKTAKTRSLEERLFALREEEARCIRRLTMHISGRIKDDMDALNHVSNIIASRRFSWTADWPCKFTVFSSSDGLRKGGCRHFNSEIF